MSNEREPGWYIYRGAPGYWTGMSWRYKSKVPRPTEMPEWSATAVARITGAMVTTLPSVPNCHIIEVHGVVTELSATSGWTATSNGNSALNDAMYSLRATAATMGGEYEANAIVGLTFSTFGAGGGITSVLGGDAVGVLLAGTAVTVELAD